VKVPGSSLLYTQPPESSEDPVLPLKALTEGFEVSLTEDGILWIFVGVSQRHEDHPPFECPESSSVDTRQPPEQIPAACSGEAPYLLSVATTAMPMRTELVTGSGVPEGECRYRSSYERGKVGNPLMQAV
jgi:hypothetical protein